MKFLVFLWDVMSELFAWTILIIAPIIHAFNEVIKRKQWIKREIKKEAINVMRRRGFPEEKMNYFK